MSLASMACCCTSATCTACTCCSGAASSTMTRVGYAVLLLLGILVQIFSMTEWVATKMVNFGRFKCEDGKQPGGLDTTEMFNLIPVEYRNDTRDVVDQVGDFFNSASKVVLDIYNKGNNERDESCLFKASYFVVYRIAFANFVFFTTLALIMIKVKSSNDPRAGLQNGFWGAKFVVLLAGMVGCLFIPAGQFDSVFYIFGLIFALLFIVWQLALLVNFAHDMNEYLLEKMDNDSENERFWKGVLIFFSFGLYIACLVAVIVMFIKFGPSGCSLHQFFISMVIILAIICGIIATNEQVQDSNPASGILQAAAVSSYVCYMTFSAMTSNNAQATCNPYANNMQELLQGLSGLALMNGSTVFGMIFAVLIVLYSTVSSTVTNTDGSASTSSDIPMLEAGGDNGEKGQVRDDEANGTTYNYSFYHLVTMFATLYVMMMLTNWRQPENSDDLPNMWPAVWVKIISAWLACLMYVWTLVAPLLMPDRDWS